MPRNSLGYVIVTDDLSCPTCESPTTGDNTGYECPLDPHGCGKRFCKRCANKTGDPKTTQCPHCQEVWYIQTFPRDNEASIGGNHANMMRQHDQ